MITCDPSALQAVREELSRRGTTGPVRIDLCFTGCCDPSLGLMVDHARESDLVQEIEGVQFVISKETYDLVGDITLSYVDNRTGKGFILTSSKPVSEWAGFTVSTIKDGKKT
jgi:Fe-S cluster assembly iron-binding protein IscA